MNARRKRRRDLERWRLAKQHGVSPVATAWSDLVKAAMMLAEWLRECGAAMVEHLTPYRQFMARGEVNHAASR